MTQRFRFILSLTAICICISAACGTTIGGEDPGGGSDLVRHFGDLVNEDPSLPLPDLIRLANDALDGGGLRYSVVLVNEPVDQPCDAAAGGGKDLVLKEPERPTDSLCATRLVCGLDVKRFVDDRIELAEPGDGRRADIPEGLSFAVAVVVRPRTGTIVSKFYLPGLNGGDLYRVSTDGESVFFRVRLPQSASAWWSRIRAGEPDLQDEESPFLALRISRDRMRFEKKVAFMTAPLDSKPPLEFPPRFRGWPHRAFESNGYLVLYFDPCASSD